MAGRASSPAPAAVARDGPPRRLPALLGAVDAGLRAERRRASDAGYAPPTGGPFSGRPAPWSRWAPTGVGWVASSARPSTGPPPRCSTRSARAWARPFGSDGPRRAAGWWCRCRRTPAAAAGAASITRPDWPAALAAGGPPPRPTVVAALIRRRRRRPSRACPGRRGSRTSPARSPCGARAPRPLRGPVVLLVDDVSTSGATLRACRAAAPGGAAEVRAAVVARAR
jgi:hypothetical protein